MAINKKTKKYMFEEANYYKCNRITADRVNAYLKWKGKKNKLCSDHNGHGLQYLGESLTKEVIMMGPNLYEPADDEDILNNNELDPDLKDIIRRVVQVKTPDNFYASAFVAGKSCNKIVTAKHNFYKRKTGARYVGGRHVAMYKGTEYGLELKSNIGSWTDADEGIIVNSERPISGLQCRKVPVITRNNIKAFKDCFLIGYPSEVLVKNNKIVGGTGKSIIKKKDGSLYDFGKRGIVSCSVKKNYKGEIIHDCSSSQGASGGVITCKVQGRWSYVSVQGGGDCFENGETDYAKCFNKNGGDPYYLKDRDNKIFGSGGSFVEDF